MNDPVTVPFTEPLNEPETDPEKLGTCWAKELVIE
jgi:hypothetical protein